MIYIEKKSIVELPKTTGSIVNTTNITDKTTNTYSAEVIDNLVSENGGTDISTIIDLIYPIGRGFIDFTNTDYSNWLGLTWERELLGVTPIGYNPNDTDYSTVGKTGGSKTKTISKENLPNYTLYDTTHTHTQNAHSHGVPSYSSSNGSSSGISHEDATSTVTNWNAYTTNTATATNQSTRITVTSGGSGTALDVRTPYQVVSYWKRVS